MIMDLEMPLFQILSEYANTKSRPETTKNYFFICLFFDNLKRKKEKKNAVFMPPLVLTNCAKCFSQDF